VFTFQSYHGVRLPSIKTLVPIQVMDLIAIARFSVLFLCSLAAGWGCPVTLAVVPFCPVHSLRLGVEQSIQTKVICCYLYSVFSISCVAGTFRRLCNLLYGCTNPGLVRQLMSRQIYNLTGTILLCCLLPLLHMLAMNKRPKFDCHVDVNGWNFIDNFSG